MNGWSEVFLGVIAVATLAIAIVQIGLLVAAGLLARRLGRLVDDIHAELKPVIGHLDSIGRDASKAASLVTARVEQFDQMFRDMAHQMEQMIGALQSGLSTPVREGRAMLSGLRAALAALREMRGRRRASDDEDALFI